MDARTHTAATEGGAVVHWWSRQTASVCTVLMFVHSFDGVRHAGCVGVWSGAFARRRYDALPSLSPDAVFFAQSARPRTDAPLTKTDRGNAAQTQREQRLAGAYQGWLVMRGCTRAQECVQQKETSMPANSASVGGHGTTTAETLAEAYSRLGKHTSLTHPHTTVRPLSLLQLLPRTMACASFGTA